MKAPQFDPGLTQQFEGPLRRVINKDGTFNVRRRGDSWRDIHPYLWLIDVSWTAFWGVLLAGYIAANLVFGSIYFLLGDHALNMTNPTVGWRHFLTCFFFSAQTLTTVGYGTVAPNGLLSNFLATLEAGLGLVGLSVATGLVFGRVSRPSARIAFSENIVVAPYQDGKSLQFRIVNKRRNSLTGLEATVLLMTVERSGTDHHRQYRPLRLERPSVFFFPLTWTIVHPIDSESPLASLESNDLERLQAEFLILVRAYDETFSQTVQARYSYRYDEMVWGARFSPAFHIDGAGDLVLEVDRVGALAAPEGDQRATGRTLNSSK